MFCDKRKIDPIQASIEYVIEFLTELFEMGLSYETINTARSSLSSLCIKHDGCFVGSHPLVVRFLNGVYNLRPTKPKYVETWDVSKVLRYLKTLSPVVDLDLKRLTYKLVMLTALTQASRSQSISLLCIKNMKKDQKSLTLYFSGLLKQSRKGKVNPSAVFHLYEPDVDICVYRTLLEYLQKTEEIRGTETQLILSYIKPHKPVVTTTISRWIKIVMKNSGIDVEQYTAHSTRSAISSKVKKFGVPVTEIMKVAGWSTVQTFARFYDKPMEATEGHSFQLAALQ